MGNHQQYTKNELKLILLKNYLLKIVTVVLLSSGITNTLGNCIFSKLYILSTSYFYKEK